MFLIGESPRGGGGNLIAPALLKTDRLGSALQRLWEEDLHAIPVMQFLLQFFRFY